MFHTRLIKYKCHFELCNLHVACQGSISRRGNVFCRKYIILFMSSRTIQMPMLRLICLTIDGCSFPLTKGYLAVKLTSSVYTQPVFYGQSCHIKLLQIWLYDVLRRSYLSCFYGFFTPNSCTYRARFAMIIWPTWGCVLLPDLSSIYIWFVSTHLFLSPWDVQVFSLYKNMACLKGIAAFFV